MLLARFGSSAGFEAWRTDPEQTATMDRGRGEWLDAYWGGEVLRRMFWDRHDGRTGYDESNPPADRPVTIIFGPRLRAGADAVAFQSRAVPDAGVALRQPRLRIRRRACLPERGRRDPRARRLGSPAGLRSWSTDADHQATMDRGREESLEHGWTGELVVQETWERERAS